MGPWLPTHWLASQYRCFHISSAAAGLTVAKLVPCESPQGSECITVVSLRASPRSRHSAGSLCAPGVMLARVSWSHEHPWDLPGWFSGCLLAYGLYYTVLDWQREKNNCTFPSPQCRLQGLSHQVPVPSAINTATAFTNLQQSGAVKYRHCISILSWPFIFFL